MAAPIHELQRKPPFRKLGCVGTLFAFGILCFFYILPCTIREINSRSITGQNIHRLKLTHNALSLYQSDHNHYPASLDAPDFQSYIEPSDAHYYRKGHIIYHPPTPDSLPTFTILSITTPRGVCSIQLDGNYHYSSEN